MINIVLFGKPGAGKGTQANFLKIKYSLVHISTGDLFRYNLKNKTELGKLAKSFMDKGDLVPDQVTIKMLEEEVKQNTNAKGFLFDGFPRTKSQAEALDNFLENNKMQINATISLEVEDNVIIKRLLERGKSSGRIDDQNESKIINRFKEYNKKTAPLKTYYNDQNKFYSVSGIGSIDIITNRLVQVIDSLQI
jgi:Adenylate kinase and related kinases